MLRTIAILLAGLSTLLSTDLRAGGGTAHDLSFTSIDGEPLPLGAFEGQALLVVNTASLCGFTHQYGALQALFDGYRERGLVVLGVPSNDFGGQEPGSAAEIKEFCEVNFAIDFPLTEKQAVRGAGAHPFYRRAVDALGERASPRWNFHKILIAPDGAFVETWPSRTEPDAPEVVAAIEAVLPR